MAQMSLIKASAVDSLAYVAQGSVEVHGCVGSPVVGKLCVLNAKLEPAIGYVKIAPAVPISFAVCDMTTNLDVILCQSACIS